MVQSTIDALPYYWDIERMWKYLLAWFPMILLAIVNGTIREAFV